jgi:glycine/D-amino acid oxidase-like deaminating enzyme
MRGRSGMCRFVVVSAGIAGASAAYMLPEYGRTLLLERETVPVAGRSAAVYAETHGSLGIRALTINSGRFLRSPVSEIPLLAAAGPSAGGRDR